MKEMMSLKLMILGKPRSQPKKILNKAKTKEELDILLSAASDEDISKFYGLSLNDRKNIIDAIFRFINDKNFLLYVRGLSDDEYDPSRFTEWLNYRKKHKAVSNSDEYFKVKYGNNWESHKKEYLTNKPNIYDPSYWVSKGLSDDAVIEKIKKLKYETSLSLSRCIEIYGDTVGREKHKFIHRFHKNYIDYWDDNIDGFQKYKREANRCTVDFWIKRGYSLDESRKMISDTQKLYSGLHKEYWESRGLTKEEIKNILENINTRKDGSSLKFCMDKYGKNGESIYNERRLVKSSCFREYGKLAEELHQGFKGYSASVDRFTRQSLSKIPECPGKRGRHKGEYHLDHMYSKMQGYLDGINPEIIGNPLNLEWILVEENCSKRMKCSLTLDELMEKINENKKN
jgi:hypothetical protein